MKGTRSRTGANCKNIHGVEMDTRAYLTKDEESALQYQRVL